MSTLFGVDSLRGPECSFLRPQQLGEDIPLGQVLEEDLPSHRYRNSTFRARVVPPTYLNLADLIQEGEPHRATGSM